jgi:hypothetical protein
MGRHKSQAVCPKIQKRFTEVENAPTRHDNLAAAGEHAPESLRLVTL